MECTLAILIACFSWSNLYVDAGITSFDRIEPYQEWRETIIRHDWGIETVGNSVTTDDPRNPYGRFSFGYEMSFGNLILGLEAVHQSSLATGRDRGSNGVQLHARWFPFRH